MTPPVLNWRTSKALSARNTTRLRRLNGSCRRTLRSPDVPPKSASLVELLEHARSATRRLEEAHGFLKRCEATVRLTEGLNFLQRVDLDAERRRIAGRLQSTKGGSLIGFQSSPFERAPKKALPPPAKISDHAPWKRGRVDGFRRAGVSPLLSKNTPPNPRPNWDALSVQGPSPVKANKFGRPSRAGPTTEGKEKSDCSGSQFHLSVLKSEKYSVDTRTKGSVAQHVYEPRTHHPRGMYPRLQAPTSRPPPSDQMEEQAKMTVFKTTLGTNGLGQPARKPF